jgi:putative dimethyl sulfoxide reductase chaperone
MDTTMRAEAAAARSAVYWLFADLFLTCPDEASVARLRGSIAPAAEPGSTNPMIEELATLRDALPANSAGISALAVEYTRLFGALSKSYGPPPPYETVHRGSSLSTDATAAVGEFYAAAGLVPTDQAAPPDHLGVELRFLALLCHEEAVAWQRGADAEAAQLRQQQRDFLDRHLLRWAPAYFDLVQANTKHPFYLCLTSLARRVIAEDDMVIEDCYAG